METTNTNNTKQHATTTPNDTAAQVAGVKSLIADLGRRMALAVESEPSQPQSESEKAKSDANNQK